MLNAAELAAMQETVEEALPDTATLLRPTKTSDGQGGRATTWAAIGTYPCIVLPASDPQERQQAHRNVSRAPWVVRLPQGTALTHKDRLQVSGATYEVTGVDAGLSYGVALEAACERIDD